MTNQRATYNIKMEKKLKMERLAIEASLKIGRTIKWTELMDVLVTEFSKDAQEMIIHREKEKNERGDKSYCERSADCRIASERCEGI